MPTITAVVVRECLPPRLGHLSFGFDPSTICTEPLLINRDRLLNHGELVARWPRFRW